MKQIHKAFRDLFNGSEKELNLPMLPIDTYKSMLEEQFDCVMEELDDNLNGWDVDFGYYFMKDNTRYQLYGSLWYGNFKFEKCNE